MKSFILSYLVVLFCLLSSKTEAQWVQTSGSHMKESVFDFAILDTNLFAVFHDSFNYSDSVFLSTNNGVSWAAANTDLPLNIPITALAVSGTNLFTGTLGGGVFVSTNNGSNWTSVNNGLMNKDVRALAVSGS
jgi:photosystem II stability/assembly factor-like uncharacterized protein